MPVDAQSLVAALHAQIRIGTAKGRLDTAELIARQVAAECARWGSEADVCPVDQRVRHRVLMAQAVRMVRDVVRDLFEASGAGAHLATGIRLPPTWCSTSN